MDVLGGVPAAWMPAVHAGMTDALLRLPVEFVSWASTGESLFPRMHWEKARLTGRTVLCSQRFAQLDEGCELTFFD